MVYYINAYLCDTYKCKSLEIHPHAQAHAHTTHPSHAYIPVKYVVNVHASPSNQNLSRRRAHGFTTPLACRMQTHTRTHTRTHSKMPLFACVCVCVVDGVSNRARRWRKGARSPINTLFQYPVRVCVRACVVGAAC